MLTPRRFLTEAATAARNDRDREAIAAALRALDHGRLPADCPFQSVEIALNFGVSPEGDPNYGEYGQSYTDRRFNANHWGLFVKGWHLHTDGVSSSDTTSKMEATISPTQADATIEHWSSVPEGTRNGPFVWTKP